MVADASVIAAIAFKEPEAERARELLGTHELSAPVLLAFELSNIARSKIRALPQQRTAITEDLADALAMPFHWLDVPYVAVLDLALETGLTAYDASYLYLAMTLRAPLATFDRDLRAAAAGRVPLA